MIDGWSERGASEELRASADTFDRLGESDLAELQREIAAVIAPDADHSGQPAFEPIQLRNLAVGRGAWCAANALMVGTDDRYYVCVEAFAYARPAVEPGVTLRVERRADGWHAWPRGETVHLAPGVPDGLRPDRYERAAVVYYRRGNRMCRWSRP